MYWCDSWSCVYVFFLHWQTLFAGVLAFAGVILTVVVLVWQVHTRQRHRAHIAAMQVAAQIRRWLIDTIHAFEVGPNRVAEERAMNPDDNPDHYVFPTPGDIPEFPFRDALESISLLKPEDAKRLFDAIELRLSAERSASAAIEYGSDNQAAAEILEALIAGVFVECASIYSQLAPAGWPASAVSDDEIKIMREKAAKLDEIRSRSTGIDLTGL